MLKIGLGFQNPNQSNALPLPSPVSDWANWDGSNDGAITNIATAGGTGSQDIVMTSDTEAVMIFQASDNSSQMVVLDIVDKVVQPITTNTAITLTHADSTGMNIVKLSDTKFVVLYESTTSGSTGVVALITKSGKSLTETDVETAIGLTTPNFRCCLTELNTTKAAAVMRDDGDSNLGKIFVIDITTDNITIGTPVSLSSAFDYPAICKAKIDGSAFWVANTDSGAEDSSIRYCTLSETTITVEARIDIVEAVDYDDMMLAYIDEDVCVCAYETASGSTVSANAFSWDGMDITRGTQATDIFGSTDLFQATGTVTELGNRQAMFAGRLQDISLQGGAVVVTVDESLVCTAGTPVLHFPSIQADHDVIDASPSGLYVLACCQDETTTPIQQIGTRVLQGFSS